MEKTDVIELNGKEYVVQLNRQSYVAIDKYTNISKTIKAMNEEAVEYVDEVKEGVDPFEDLPTTEKILSIEEQKIESMKKLYIRAFWVWLYPKNKLDIDKVAEIINVCFEDDEQFNCISEKFSDFMDECIKIKHKEEEELKNLKALAK